MSIALAIRSAGNLGKVLVATALLAAGASALPQIRPWEYFNELAGGSANGYRYFIDDSVDLGQRAKEFTQFARRELQPKGERPSLKRGDQERARRAYADALKFAGNDSHFHSQIQEQIQRVSVENLANIAPLCFGSDPQHDQPIEELSERTGTIFPWTHRFLPIALLGSPGPPAGRSKMPKSLLWMRSQVDK